MANTKDTPSTRRSKKTLPRLVEDSDLNDLRFVMVLGHFRNVGHLGCFWSDHLREKNRSDPHLSCQFVHVQPLGGLCPMQTSRCYVKDSSEHTNKHKGINSLHCCIGNDPHIPESFFTASAHTCHNVLTTLSGVLLYTTSPLLLEHGYHIHRHPFSSPRILWVYFRSLPVLTIRECCKKLVHRRPNIKQA